MSYKNKLVQREYQRQWIALRKLKFFLNKKCACCNKTTNLQLDHIDPELKTDHKIWSWSESRRNLELSKCQILCEDCHKIKTREMLEPVPTHGTSYMYNDLHCRCNQCRAWNRIRKKRQ